MNLRATLNRNIKSHLSIEDKKGYLAMDSSTSGSLVGAVDWLKAALLGPISTTVAVLAIAAVGLLMLGGRVPVRRGATVVVGCFILFSATKIAAGLVDSVGQMDAEPVSAAPAPQPSFTPSAPRPVPYDPYAGASVPVQREQPIIR